jgi:diguanylate cyclase (GGDEF)-like protein
MKKFGSIEILLVEDNPGDVRLIEEMVEEVNSRLFVVECVSHLADVKKFIGKNHYFDAILLDLNLPDSQGFETLTETVNLFPHIPVIVLTGLGDETMGIEAVQKGAQDFLIKGQFASKEFERTVLHGIERHRVKITLHNQSLMDDLTGLHNRRGFFKLAEHQRKVALRNGQSMILLYIDLDGLKWINDRFGHSVGDEALQLTGNIIKKTFRSSDIMARIGGDEFVVLALQTEDSPTQILLHRFMKNIEDCNGNHRKYEISLSVGSARWSPIRSCSIESLLDQADEAMYLHKKAKCTDKKDLSQ